MKRRRPILIAAALGIAALAFATFAKIPYRLVYNPSESAPRGWYALIPATTYDIGMLVLARLPPGAASLAAERGYLPRGVPILKRIGAGAGQEACERRGAVRIDGQLITRARVRDGRGRVLVPWEGCRTLTADEVLLLGLDSAASFDGRYFGPIPRTSLLGRALPVWTW